MPAIKHEKIVVEFTPVELTDSKTGESIGQKIDSMVQTAIERHEPILSIGLQFESADDFYHFANKAQMSAAAPAKSKRIDY